MVENEEKNVTLSLKVPESLKIWLKIEAVKDRRTISNYAMMILEQHKKNMEKKD